MTFSQGLNVVVADRRPSSTDKQTRNRRGKSSLVGIFDYLFGSDDFLTDSAATHEHTFGITFDVRGRDLSVSRSPDTNNEVVIEGKAPPELKVEVDADGRTLASVKSWRAYLGYAFFGLPIVRENEWKKHAPSYRNLIAYFIRSANAFTHPEANGPQQKDVQKQLAISFFLDFDWRIAQSFEDVREKEKTVRQLKLEYKELDPAEARSELAVLERTLTDQQKLMRDFRVVPQFRELEKEASRIARSLRDLSDENTTDRELLDELGRALSTEAPPSLERVEDLYSEASVLFSDQIRRRLEEVRDFHSSVLHNRMTYLEREISAAEKRIASREARKVKHEGRRSEIFSILKSGGALEQHANLQAELARLENDVKRLRAFVGQSADFKNREADLAIARETLRKQLSAELEERKAVIQEAIVSYESVSSALYGQAGKLIIDDTKNGPKLAFPIQGEKSAGINNMRIFCFDMMLMNLLSRRGLGPGFMVHDSHLFDPVDERQVATALAVGAAQAESSGWQYIVTLNSDALPPKSAFPKGFDLERHINPVRLTDDLNGGLFGAEF
jgi:uncharacterized protein YydD (DUF2326 family)